jgi:hypothetical protein
VCVQIAQFFSSRSNGLVGAGADEIVLDCYRLARWYYQAPDVFLNMPLGEVQMHLRRTIELAKIMRREAED